MNKIETLPKIIKVNNNDYFLRIYVTAWNKLCIAYVSLSSDKLFSVVIEPLNKPIKIENTIDCIGNAQTFDDGVDMVAEYIKTNYNYGTKV